MFLGCICNDSVGVASLLSHNMHLHSISSNNTRIDREVVEEMQQRRYSSSSITSDWDLTYVCCCVVYHFEFRFSSNPKPI